MKAIALLTLVLGLSPAAYSQSFTTIDYPGSDATIARAMNNEGDILGQWRDQGGNWHGFLLRKDAFTSIDCQGAVSTRPVGMNSRGEIVGNYQNATGKWLGFYKGELAGPCFDIEPKGATGSWAQGISDNGEIAGEFDDADKRHHGFLLRGEVFLVFDVVEGPSNGAFGITPLGDLFGHLQTPGDRMKGWVLTKERLHVLEFPPAEQNGMTCPFGANSKGELVGHYQRRGEAVRGYLLSAGNFTSIEVPDATWTQASAINDAGLVAGHFVDKGNKTHGFLWRR